MPVSYAQICEDLILHRPLRRVQRGFYIDVGAQNPNVESVTRFFYDRGWSGINIEPVREWFDQLVRDRPRDINLQVAAGVTSDEVDFYEIPESGLSTMSAVYAERHKQAGWACRRERVAVRPLAEICREYVTGEIHFLKVDAEGAELAVLEGCDFVRYRPWIVLIEAAEPLSEIEAYHDCEALLLAADYEFAGADQLNRYYVARERGDLKRPLAEGLRKARRRTRLWESGPLRLVRRIVLRLSK